MAMKNKAYRLVKLLNDDEAKLFRQHLILLKRKGLLALFHEIRNNTSDETPVQKANLFKAVFGIAYTKEQDFLLRNELRLLNCELIKLVSDEQMKMRMQQDSEFRQTFFIEWLSHKNVWEWEEKESIALIEVSKAKGDYSAASQMLKRYAERYIYQKEATEANYKDLLNRMDDFYQAAAKEYLYRTMEIKMKQAFAERTLKAINPDFVAANRKDIVPDLKREMESDNYLLLTHHITESYHQAGEQKIKTLKAALKLCSKIRKKGFEKNATVSSIAALLALEYFLQEDYANAITYHQKALQETEGIQQQQVISYVFNYLSTMLRLNKYKDTVHLIKNYEPIWSGIPRMKDRFLCLLAMSHVFLKQPDEAWSCLPHNRKKSGLDHYYYYRFIQIIVYLMKKEYRLAISETETFIHTIRNHDKNAAYLKLTLALKKYLHLLNDKPVMDKQSLKKKCNKLLQGLGEEKRQVELAEHALLYRWLVAAIEGEVN